MQKARNHRFKVIERLCNVGFLYTHICFRLRKLEMIARDNELEKMSKKI